MKFISATLAVLAVLPAASAVNLKGYIKVENIAPVDGTFQTPLWVAIHDGGFDSYDRFAPVTPGLELLAEDGATNLIADEFNNGDAGRYFEDTTADGPILPTEYRTVDFDVDVAGDAYFSYASMVLPSNDAFIANGDPFAHQIYSAVGGATNVKFVVKGSAVLDAGSEENTEAFGVTAGLPGNVFQAGDIENGVVEVHPGFAEGGNILNAIPNGDFTAPGYKVVVITVVIKEVDGEPGPTGFGAMGDPHFRRWDSSWYDFHGACDLVLLAAKNFADSMALNVYIRTKIRYDYSFIETAVVQLGKDTLELSSWGEHTLNGVAGGDLTETLAGYPITYSQPSDKVHSFEIQISEKETITLASFKDMVSVKFDAAEEERYQGSYGMLGGFSEKGAMIARDGKTVIEDPVAMAAEWQVRPEEDGMIFQTAKGPQYPAKCAMPDAKVKESRRLGSSLAVEKAEKACADAGWDEASVSVCVHDVLATGDLELAAAGAF